jgi:hypothetical protein
VCPRDLKIKKGIYNMKKFFRSILTGIAAIMLTTGVYASAQSGSIDTTGPDSDNEISYSNEVDIDVDNDTDVDADVDVDQDADSGNTEVNDNTEGGDAESGDAENDNSVEAEVDVDNSGGNGWLGLDDCICNDGDATIDKTGPDSTNTVTFDNSYDLDIDNSVDVDFDVDVDQDADSGDAEVTHNTSGGNATSGSASNTSSTVFSLSVKN